MTKKLLVKAKAMYHIGDLSKTVRRGVVLELTAEEAQKSNDLWKGQQFGLLEVKWVTTPDLVPAKPVEAPILVPSQVQHPVAHVQGVTIQEVREAIGKEASPIKSNLASLEQKVTKLEKKVEDLTDLLTQPSNPATTLDLLSSEPETAEPKTRRKRGAPEGAQDD
jgi:hypothetical protein